MERLAGINQLLSDLFRILNENDFMDEWKLKSDVATCYVNKPGLVTTPLTKAISNKWTDVVMWFIENGADVNQIDPCGDTPLAECIRCENISMMKLLINHGATVKSHDSSILRRIIHIRNIDIAKFIINIDNSYIDSIIDGLYGFGQTWNISTVRYLHIERIRNITMIFTDLPQYIILWITDWLLGSEYLKEYEKIEFIERVQCSIRKIEKTLA